jgi:hypothetical protein
MLHCIAVVACYYRVVIISLLLINDALSKRGKFYGRRSFALLVRFLVGFRINRLAASLRVLFGKPLAEHWLARSSETRRQAVYDVDRSEDVLVGKDRMPEWAAQVG